MSASIRPVPDSPTVTVAGGAVHIQELIETDPTVVATLEATDDPEAATHTLLHIGARSVQLASTDLDIKVVEQRFDSMTGTFGTTVDQAVTSIATAADQLLNEETGTLPQVIAELRGELTTLLSDTFDPDSKTSALAKIETVLDGSSEQLARSIRATFSLDQPDSPLTRTKREMTEVIQREVGTVLTEVRNLQQSVAATAAVAEVSDKLTAKGVGFEELIGFGLAPFAGVHGDVVEPVGRTSGATGTRKGDLLVTLCADDTAGHATRFVVEAKDQKLSMTKTLAELDAALANHDASAAIAVFANEDQAPIALPFWYSGNRAILVYDKHDPEPRALQLAYEWARWLCRRTRYNAEPQLDLEAITTAVDRARQALQRHQSIKACHSAIKKKADEASGHVADLVTDVGQAIDDLLAILHDAEERAA